MKKFKQNRMPGDENKYDNFINQLYPYLKPFSTTTQLDMLINKSVGQNYNVLVNNLEAFESTVFGVDPYKTGSTKNPPTTHNMRFLMDRYIVGLTKLTGNDKRGGGNIRRVPLTPNEMMNIQSFLLFSPSVIRYSNIYLPTSSILDKAQLHTARIYYFKLLTDPIHLANVRANNYFLKNMVALTNDAEEEDQGQEKYRTFLDAMIPKTLEIFNLYKKNIRNPTSYMKIINQLEPFMIYDSDIIYESYEEIVKFMDDENTEWMKIFIANRQLMERYQNINYNVKLHKDPLFSQITKLNNALSLHSKYKMLAR